ncbi:hypothetical protein GGQ61_000147 [Phenylobacterium haematophilum]|uniref:Glycosyltransferase RgtA/B/C/D-like domain-containing protein n=1 Tax=Phenylobacterium haematophilum TaxID=98513 RepID=A0A839ZVY1_9CAUL|nr:hypothetical protein [Phenylobacterium haematophilum]MBB3889450.1 hypothetical protein [Phenylobacterium haematophilum]
MLTAAAIAVALVYLDRVFLEAPLYTGAESTHLVHALFGKTLAARPDLLPQAQSTGDTLFGLLIRALTYATQNLLPWLRILGAAAYFGGLALALASVRTSMDRPGWIAAALLALAYPYYRFAAAALPEGWYVLLLGAAVLATARLYGPRPIAHAALAGVLVGALTLLKPQGPALGIALLLLAVVDLLLGRRDLRIFVGRIAVLAAAFLASVNLLQLAANQASSEPLTFYLEHRYDGLLEGAISQDGWIAGARGLVAMAASCVMLAGIPALTGLLRVEMRWRWHRGRGRFFLTPHEASFLLVLFTAALTLVLTALLGTGEAANPTRIWGRQFEALVPLLWIAAAPFIGEFDRAGGRWWRLAMGAVPVVGLSVLTACLLGGVVPRAWDAAALSAFSLESPITAILAGAIVVAAGAATAFRTWPVMGVWLTAFVALAALSTALDVRWERATSAARGALAQDLTAAAAIIEQRPGGVALLAQDPIQARLAYLRLRARPITVQAAPDAARLTEIDTIVSLGAQAPGPGWKVSFHGAGLTVYTRQTGPSASARASLAGGGGLLSEPGSS